MTASSHLVYDLALGVSSSTFLVHIETANLQGFAIVVVSVSGLRTGKASQSLTQKHADRRSITRTLIALAGPVDIEPVLRLPFVLALGASFAHGATKGCYLSSSTSLKGALLAASGTSR